MATPTKIATKTKWALDDIIVHQCRAIEAVRQIMHRNEQKFMDPMIAMQLARLSDALGSIKAIAATAKQGDYDQEH